ncbi:hypothetical protein KFE25_005503 [Diacronema lutheri]|uniref:Uncharacterized protein n=2 Tax=Diacronema lutheri TaxID=2081491 RepID=A0A8J5XF66_DIALT|nr:hypothetical protein KFE25_005503 [Diacronema lutheri]
MSPFRTLVLAAALVGAASGFSVRPTSAFAASPIARSSAPCVRLAASVSMACRTNTKREKFFRNLENAKRFRKASWKPAFKGRGGPRSNDSTPESKEDAALMATIYVTTDASGESIESAPERERALAA